MNLHLRPNKKCNRLRKKIQNLLGSNSKTFWTSEVKVNFLSHLPVEKEDGDENEEPEKRVVHERRLKHNGFMNAG